jgi:transposase
MTLKWDRVVQRPPERGGNAMVKQTTQKEVLHSLDRAVGRKKMGRPHSEYLRSRVVAAIKAGASYRQVATRYGVSASAAVKWVQRYRQTGSVAPKPMGGDHRSRLKSERNWLLQRVAAEPGLTLAELHKQLCARGIRVGYLTVRRFVKKEKIDLR